MQSQRTPAQKSSPRPFYVLSDPDPTAGSTLQFIEPEELQRIHQLREIAQRRAQEEQFRRQYAERIRRQKERDMLAAAELRRQQELYQREVERLRELKRLSRQQQKHQQYHPQSQQIPPWAVLSPYGLGTYAPQVQQHSPFFGPTPGVQYLPYGYLPFAPASGPHHHYHESYPYYTTHDREEAKEGEENQSRELDDQLAEFLLPFFFTKKLGGSQPTLKELRDRRRARKSEEELFGRSKDATHEGSEAASESEQMETDEQKPDESPNPEVPPIDAHVIVEDVTSQVDTASVGEPEITEASSETGRKEVPFENEAEKAERQSAAAKIQHAWRAARPHLSSSLKCRTLDALASEVDKLAFLNERRALAAPLAFVNADESGALVTGAKENKAFMQHEEALTRILLKLDNITSDGEPKVRDKRREVIASVQRHLDALDAHKRQQRELRIAEAAKLRSQESTTSVDPVVRKVDADGTTSEIEVDSPAPHPTVSTKPAPIPEEQPATRTPVDATTQTVMAKVRYRNVLRQLPLADTKWADFIARVRKVHSIPENLEITVTHTDEDGDVIAIDSDEELVDLIGFVRRGGIRVVRFDAA